MSFVEIFNMPQKQIDEELDRMYFQYMQERDLANRAEENRVRDELFAREFDLLMNIRAAGGA